MTQAPWDINKPAKVAYIREDACIGCTKCLPDCPTDAILGGPKQMHTVIVDACTACELCIPTCPVDCIEMRDVPARTDEEKQQLSTMWQVRFDKHNTREKHIQTDTMDTLGLNSMEARQAYIADVLKRQGKPE